MSYLLKTNYADPTNYGTKRKASAIKYIVIHYTANDGDHDESNANYFHRNKKLGASAHYFVDDDSVTISVPDLNVAWSVGGSRYKNYKITGGAKYYGKCTNSNSISIELCDTKKDGVHNVTSATIENALELTRTLMAKYNVPKANVIRHFDVTGKECPAYWTKDATWKSEFWNKLDTSWDLVFNAAYYANRYPDLASAGLTTKDQLLQHFISFGMSEHRQAISSFNPEVYKANNPDLATTFGTNWPAYYNHYIQFGYKEGRKAI